MKVRHTWYWFVLDAWDKYWVVIRNKVLVVAAVAELVAEVRLAVAELVAEVRKHLIPMRTAPKRPLAIRGCLCGALRDVISLEG